MVNNLQTLHFSLAIQSFVFRKKLYIAVTVRNFMPWFPGELMFVVFSGITLIELLDMSPLPIYFYMRAGVGRRE